jgi:hypothetical protein
MRTVLAALMAACAMPALAQTPDSASAAEKLADRCFDVIVPANNAFSSPILIDHCNGSTWLLAREGRAVKGKSSEDFSYVWHPLLVGNNEAVLSLPSLPGFPAR